MIIYFYLGDEWRNGEVEDPNSKIKAAGELPARPKGWF